MTINSEIEKATTEALISYVSIYKSLKINKEIAKLCMIELDKRQRNGEVTDLDQVDKISNLLSEIGNGFAVRVATKEQIQEVINELNKINISSVKVGNNLIYIGKVSETQKQNIQNISGVLEVISDKSSLDNL